MKLADLLSAGILAAHTLYSPTVVPVDYGGGSFVYNLSLHLSDGTPLTRSSLELADSPDGEQERFDATLALLRESVARAGLSPRCDYLNAPLTAAYRAAAGISPPVRLVSACLCGEGCRYDGGAHLCADILAQVADGEAVPVCPELLGGLAVPRAPCEIKSGRVLDAQGNDHTAAFAAGAQKTLALARTLGVSEAVLKAKSPSCGVSQVYDGTFSRVLTAGEGLCAALLREHGFTLHEK